jgi:hypothetical protein
MAISLTKFVQERLRESDEWKQVAGLADDLQRHLGTDDALSRIREANQPKRSSAAVQATFGEFVRDLGFESERVGLFASADFALRPDYFLRLGNTGILAGGRARQDSHQQPSAPIPVCHRLREPGPLRLRMLVQRRRAPAVKEAAPPSRARPELAMLPDAGATRRLRAHPEPPAPARRSGGARRHVAFANWLR